MVGFMQCFISCTLAPEKCFTTTYFLNFGAFEIVCPYAFFNIHSPKVTVAGALFLCFCSTLFFSCPCWSENSYYWLDHFCLDHDRFVWCCLIKLKNGSVKKNLYCCLLFFIFDDFRGVWNWYSWLSVVLPVLFSLLLFSFLIKNHCDDSSFGFNYTFRKLIWSFRDFISILLSSQCADVSQCF